MPPRNTSLAPATFGDATGDQAAGDRLGETQGQPALAQQLQHHGLHRVVVDAEHDVADERAHLARPSGRAARRPRPSVAALAVRRTLMPSHPLARNASVGLPSVVEPVDDRVEAFVQAALALAPRAQRAADDDAGLAAHAPAGRAARPAAPCPSSRGARRARRRPPSARPSTMTGQISPGAVPRVCGMMAGADRHERLAKVVLGHSTTARLRTCRG